MELLRLLTLRGWLDAALTRMIHHKPEVAVLEGVAFHRVASQAAVAALYQTHAIARLALADAGIYTEVVPPTTVRDALNGERLRRGADGKALNRQAVLERFGYAWDGDGEGDRADAYALTQVNLEMAGCPRPKTAVIEWEQAGPPSYPNGRHPLGRL